MATLKKSGHRKVFDDKQNAALREALGELKERKKLSQAALGELLGIKQQNAGRLLKSREQGFAYASATNLVHALGYANVETFFRAKEVASGSDVPQAKSA